MLSQRGLHIKVCTRHTHVTHLSLHAAKLSLAIDCAHLLTNSRSSYAPPLRSSCPTTTSCCMPSQRLRSELPLSNSSRRQNDPHSQRIPPLRATYPLYAFRSNWGQYRISVSQPALPLPPIPRRSLLRYAHLHNRQRLLLPGQQYDIVTELESSTLSQISSHLSRSSSRREPRCAFT
jgi:hypothetical protein